MNFITACFAEHETALSELLVVSGFTAEQTSGFLRAAATTIHSTFKGKDIEEIISAFGSGNPARFVNAIDIDELASKADMSPDAVKTALTIIAPVISEAFKQNSDGMVGAAISIAWEEKRDFISIAKKLFGQ